MLTQQATFTDIADSELWTFFKEGSTAAYEFIYKKFYKELFNYGLYFSSDNDVVFDNIQNVFSYLFEKRASIGSTNNIKYYLFLCLKRSIINAVTKSKKTVSSDSFFNLTDTTAENKFSEPTDNPHYNKLLDSINKLSGSQKEIIYLTYYKNFSTEEIADILQITARTVYNQTYMAMQKLKKMME
jgi:RNA polymerase sigma factor (sigma-70 family)